MGHPMHQHYGEIAMAGELGHTRSREGGHIVQQNRAVVKGGLGDSRLAGINRNRNF